MLLALFYKLFELKCVLAVYVHSHPIMIKIHPSVFFYLLTSLPISHIERLSVWRHTDEGPPTIVWLTVAFQHTGVLPQTHTEWAVISCFTAGADVDKSDSKAIEVFCCWM